MLEFQEMLKCDDKFLYTLLSLTQEGNFKAGRYALISADEVIIAHTNEHEFRLFMANPRNEALRSRIMVIPVPYPFPVSAEVKIYEKLINQSELNLHLAPYSLRAAAVFSVLSRLHPTKRQGVDLITKLHLYDGQNMEGFADRDIVELKRENLREGMNGIDPRFIINRIDSVLSGTKKKCCNALDIFKGIREGLEEHPALSKEEREHLHNLLALAKKEYDEVVKNEVQKIFLLAYEQEAQALFEAYLASVEAYCGGTKPVNSVDSDISEADEDLMRRIEEQIGVSENAKKCFREELLVRVTALTRAEQRLDYGAHPKLQEAVAKKLFADLKKTVRLNLFGNNTVSTSRAQLASLMHRLIEQHGYCRICALDTIKYVDSIFSK